MGKVFSIRAIGAFKKIQPLMLAMSETPNPVMVVTSPEPIETEIDGKKLFKVTQVVAFEKLEDAKKFIKTDSELNDFVERLK